MVDISIIIVNYKSWSDLGDCLNALTRIKTKLFLFEIIVVDNQSNDGKLEGFKNNFATVKFIENTGNNGFANGCNVGANASKGNYFLFLNPDTIANEEALYELWNIAKNNLLYGIVTCTQINEQGKKYNEIRFFPSLKTLFGPFRAIYKRLHKNKILADFDAKKAIVFPDWVTGAVIFMSASWYKKINGWNEKYWLYFEDIAICKRIKNQGGEVVLMRNTSILHKHGGASRINIKTKALTKTEVLISQHVYFQEHFIGLERFVIQFLLVLSLLLTKILLAILGCIFFFVPKMKVNIFILKNLLKYYISAIYNTTWISPRATIYTKK